MIFPEDLYTQADNAQEMKYDVRVGDDGVIRGDMADERESLKNYIEKVIKTRRGRYAAYGADFGIDIGNTPSTAEIAAAVKEALMTDERILGVSMTGVVREGEKVHIGFDVESVYGDIKMQTETEGI